MINDTSCLRFYVNLIFLNFKRCTQIISFMFAIITFLIFCFIFIVFFGKKNRPIYLFVILLLTKVWRTRSSATAEKPRDSDSIGILKILVCSGLAKSIFRCALGTLLLKAKLCNEFKFAMAVSATSEIYIGGPKQFGSHSSAISR